MQPISVRLPNGASIKSTYNRILFLPSLLPASR